MFTISMLYNYLERCKVANFGKLNCCLFTGICYLNPQSVVTLGMATRPPFFRAGVNIINISKQRLKTVKIPLSFSSYSSPHNHGSVENGSLQDDRFLYNRVIFHFHDYGRKGIHGYIQSFQAWTPFRKKGRKLGAVFPTFFGFTK